MAKRYNYRVRPAKETGNLLIEITDMPEDKDFVKQLIRTFESIHIQIINYEDLWMTDEVVLNAASDVGPFTIYRDAGGYYYITANSKPDVISLLDSLLSGNTLFTKVV